MIDTCVDMLIFVFDLCCLFLYTHNGPMGPWHGPLDRRAPGQAGGRGRPGGRGGRAGGAGMQAGRAGGRRAGRGRGTAPTC
jgi:hypothetical protein